MSIIGNIESPKRPRSAAKRVRQGARIFIWSHMDYFTLILHVENEIMEKRALTVLNPFQYVLAQAFKTRNLLMSIHINLTLQSPTKKKLGLGLC